MIRISNAILFALFTLAVLGAVYIAVSWSTPYPPTYTQSR